MEKNTVLTGNKLIAKFMGYEFTETPDCGIFGGNKFTRLPKKNNKPPFIVHYGWNPPKYHESWNYLMSVVEKIESIKDNHHGYFGVYIHSNSCTIQGTKLRTDIKQNPPVYYNSFTLENKLKSTYETIVEFIKWYNKQKQ